MATRRGTMATRDTTSGTRQRALPSAHHIQGALLCVLCVALIVGLSRDVAPAARDAGQLAVLIAWGALVVLHVGGRALVAARRAVA